MRIERANGEWTVVDGFGAAAARWRLRGTQVLLRSPSGREYEVEDAHVPLEIAVALLAVRDASAFVAVHPADELSGPAALSRWPVASREPLVRAKLAGGGTVVAWRTFRATFEVVVRTGAAKASADFRVGR